jgi:hypothetical protein
MHFPIHFKKYVAFLCFYFMARIAISRRRRRPRGRKWVNSLNTGDNRNKYGAYRAFLTESRLSNESIFFCFVRMTLSQFEYIHSKIAPYIQPGSVGSGTLKKYRGGGTAVIFFFLCGSGNGSGKSTAVLPR